MAILSDKWIREKALSERMIEPFVEAQRRDGCISYGLSSYGYDARVADDFKIFTNVNSSVVDPKAFDPGSFVDRLGIDHRGIDVGEDLEIFGHSRVVAIRR